MNRRSFLIKLGTLIGVVVAAPHLLAKPRRQSIKKIIKTDEQWEKILHPDQYRILRKEGTERAFSSRLLGEKRKGIYTCAGCDLELFTSEMKYDSRTGWPSFFRTIEGHVGTKADFKLLIPRTEYHCARCDGHQGHVFNDGPKPTGKRWCNNGLGLHFTPDPSAS